MTIFLEELDSIPSETDVRNIVNAKSFSSATRKLFETVVPYEHWKDIRGFSNLKPRYRELIFHIIGFLWPSTRTSEITQVCNYKMNEIRKIRNVSGDGDV